MKSHLNTVLICVSCNSGILTACIVAMCVSIYPGPASHFEDNQQLKGVSDISKDKT